MTEVCQINHSTYHHGNLRRALIDAALEAIEESGSAGWSLRDVARRAGVSHAAPVHHFGDKTGLVTAVAAEGYELFADSLERATGDFLEVGVAYVNFAVSHPAHFAVMFRPELYRVDDPQVAAARDRARDVLVGGARTLSPEPAQDRTSAIAAWCTAHGFADLWLGGALAGEPDSDPEATARSVFQATFNQLRRQASASEAHGLD